MFTKYLSLLLCPVVMQAWFLYKYIKVDQSTVHFCIRDMWAEAVWRKKIQNQIVVLFYDPYLFISFVKALISFHSHWRVAYNLIVLSYCLLMLLWLVCQFDASSCLIYYTFHWLEFGLTALVVQGVEFNLQITIPNDRSPQ